MALTGLRCGARKKEQSKSSRQRKVDKKLQFYAKVNDAAVHLNAKKTITKKKKLRSRQKKLKAYDFSALSEFLPGDDAIQQASKQTEAKLNCKNMQKLVKKETAQLQAVLKHPSFQADPFSALHQHLLNTQPPPVAGEEKQTGKDKKKTKKKKKKKKAKEPSDIQSMDM